METEQIKTEAKSYLKEIEEYYKKQEEIGTSTDDDEDLITHIKEFLEILAE